MCSGAGLLKPQTPDGSSSCPPAGCPLPLSNQPPPLRPPNLDISAQFRARREGPPGTESSAELPARAAWPAAADAAIVEEGGEEDEELRRIEQEYLAELEALDAAEKEP